MVGIQRSNERFFSRDSLGIGEEPALASHLVTARRLYSHHGIYIGNGRIIHYARPGHGLRRGPVEEVSREYSAHARGIRVRPDRPRFDRREVVARACWRLGDPATRRAARVLGEGPKTIVLVAGLGDTHDGWTEVQPLIAANRARMFACSRQYFYCAREVDFGHGNSYGRR